MAEELKQTIERRKSALEQAANQVPKASFSTKLERSIPQTEKNPIMYKN